MLSSSRPLVWARPINRSSMTSSVHEKNKTKVDSQVYNSAITMSRRDTFGSSCGLILTDRSNSMAWSIFLGNPSIKNLPFPASQPGDLGGFLTASLIAFSRSWIVHEQTPRSASEKPFTTCFERAYLDGDLHGYNVALSDIRGDHLSEFRAGTSLLRSQQIASCEI